MKGVVFRGERECEVRDFPVPQAGPGQVVVQMCAAGICGSDLHVYRDPARSSPDQIPGHEPSGVVSQVGPDVTQVQIGDRVTVYHYLGCGHCDQCAAGFLQWCSQARGYGGPVGGAHGDFLLADERNCVPLADSLTFGDGTFIACSGGTAYSALQKLGVTVGDTVAVFGLGPVGLSAVLLAQALGGRVIGIDPVGTRRELAEKVGAEAVVDAGAADPVPALREWSGGAGVVHAVEASGSAAGRRALVASLRRGGRGVFLGVGTTEETLNLTDLVGRQLTLMGSFVLPLGMAWDLVRFLDQQRLSFEPLVTHRFPLEDAPEAYQVADEAQSGKVIFTWD